MYSKWSHFFYFSSLSSISNPALTKDCGFIEKLRSMSIMADGGFTIKEALSEVGVGLNLGWSWSAPSWWNAAWALNCLIMYSCWKRYWTNETLCVFPLKMSRLANQIVSVCAYLSNVHPAVASYPAVTSSQCYWKQHEWCCRSRSRAGRQLGYGRSYW